MRVLVVTTVHVPLDARIHERQIRALVGAGVEVTYAAPWTATGTAPELASEGIRTLDLPRALGRRRLRASWDARKLIRREAPRHDLALLHDPELVLAVAGRLRRLPPVVLDVHEDLVASLPDRAWVPRIARPAARWLGRFLERWAERRLVLLLADERYADRFSRQHPVIPNVPWLPPDPAPAGTEDRVVHIGRISAGRGAVELIEVGELLTSADGPKLDLVGPADRDVAAAVQAAHERGVLRWHGFLPNADALALARGAVAGLSLLHDLPNYRPSMPTKVVEYLALGLPAITTPIPAAERLVTATGAGVVVPFGDADAAAAAVLRLAADRELAARQGGLGREAVARDLSWDAAAPRFIDALRRVAGGRP